MGYGRATIRRGSVGFCGEAEKWKMYVQMYFYDALEL